MSYISTPMILGNPIWNQDVCNCSYAGNTCCIDILNYAGEPAINNEASEEDRRADFVNSLLRSSEVADVTDRALKDKSQEPHAKENKSAHGNEDTQSMFLLRVQ